MQGNNVNNQQLNSGVSTNNNINSLGPMPGNVQGNLNDNRNNYNFSNGGSGYIEPPRKKSNVLTFVIIFFILAGAAVGGYFAGNYIYQATHQNVSSQ